MSFQSANKILVPNCPYLTAAPNRVLVPTGLIPPSLNDPVFATLTHNWKMNEAVGNSRVDSAGSLTLAESSAVLSAAGKNGDAALFSIVADVGNSLAAASALENISEYSFAVWFKRITGTNRIFIILDSDLDAFVFLNIADDGTMVYNSSEENNAIWPSQVSVDAWHLAVATITPDTVKISIDGGTLHTGNINAAQGNISKIKFQSAGTGTGNTCYIDEAMFFNSALTQGNVTTLWNGGAGTFYTP